MNALRPVADAPVSHARYVLWAWLLAFLPSAAFFALRVALGNARLDGGPGPGMAAFAAYSILLAPLLETAVLLVLAVLLRRVPLPGDAWRVLLLAAVAALAHGAQGGIWAGLGVLWPFVVYAAALFHWLRRSWGEALLVGAAVHALYNGAFFAMAALAARLAA